jgi:hypothetical protein
MCCWLVVRHVLLAGGSVMCQWLVLLPQHCTVYNDVFLPNF